MKEDEDDQAAKISSAPVRNVSREKFHEQEYEKSMPETPRNDVHGLHADSHRRDVDELLGQIEALREHLGQMREHVSRIYEMDDLEAADENKYRERIEVTRNVMKDMDALLDKEIGWMNRGHTAQKEVKGEAVEEQPPQCPVVTPPASLTSHQQELPLNMAPPAQRTRDMHPTLRVDGTAGNCIRVRWTVAANQLRTKNKAFTSPAFELWQGGAFVLILSSYPHNMKGGFQASKGVGRVELKFCGETEFARKVHYQVAIGRNKEFTAWIMTFARGLRVLCSTSGISRMRSTRGLSSCTLKPAWKVTSMKVTSELPMLLSLLADPLLSMEEQHPCGVKALW